MTTRRMAVAAGAPFLGAGVLAVACAHVGIGPHPIDRYRLAAPFAWRA